MPVTATITVTPHSNDGAACDGVATTFTITVNPTPTVNPIGNLVFCNLGYITDLNFSGNATSFTWTNSDPTIGLATSGTGNIGSFYVTNTGIAPVTATITVTPHYSNGNVTCDGTPMTFTITVNPTPIFNGVSDQVVCNGGSTTDITFHGTATRYTWTNTDTRIGLANGGTGNIASFIATNNTTTPIVALITVTPHYDNLNLTCDGSSLTFLITVNPTPTVSSVSNQVVCNGASTTDVTFSGNATSYTWTNDNGTIGLATSGTGNINAFNATNTGTTPVTATITVTPHYTNDDVTCDGASTSFTITVNPTPSVDNVTSQVVCNSTSTTDINFTGNATSFTWTNSDPTIGLASSGTGNIAGFTATNTGTSPVVATITVTPHSSSGAACDGVPTTFTITVNPTPTVDPVTPQVLCNGITTSDINFTGNATSYTWTNTDATIGLPSSGTGNIAGFNAINTGTSPVIATITVTPHFLNNNVTCDGTPISFTITVNPMPTAAISYDGSPYCATGTAFVTQTGQTGGTYSVSPITTTGLSLNSADGSINLSTSTPGTYTVMYSFGNGLCSGTTTASIIINAQPAITPINGPSSICINNSTILTNSTPNGVWKSSNELVATIDQNGNLNAVGVGSTTITYTITNESSCSTQTQMDLTVNALPVITLPTTLQSVCINSGTTIALGSVASPTGGTWSGNGVTGTAPNQVFDPSVAGVGSALLTYTYSDGNSCSNSASTTITVNALPTITVPAASSVCVSSGLVTLVGQPAGGTWSGTGVSGNTFDPTAVALGSTTTLTYTYSDGNSCSNSASTTITVNALPTITVPAASSVCVSSGLVTLVGQPAGGTWSGTGVSGNTLILQQ